MMYAHSVSQFAIGYGLAFLRLRRQNLPSSCRPLSLVNSFRHLSPLTRACRHPGKLDPLMIIYTYSLKIRPSGLFIPAVVFSASPDRYPIRVEGLPFCWI